MDEQQQQPLPVVETASATTDRENAQSGGGAYLVAACAILVSLLIGTGMGGCVGLIGRVASDVYASRNDGSSTPLGEDVPDGLWPDGTDGNQTDGQGSGSDEQVLIEDLLGTDLAMFSHTIDGNLSASTYANAQQSVSAYVRELAVCDRNASSDIATTLRTAAWGSGSLDEALEEASKKAQETAETLRALQVPTVDGAQAGAIREDLDDAREDAVERWEAIGKELALFSRSERLSERDIASYEQEVTESTDKAVEHLATALTTSANR